MLRFLFSLMLTLPATAAELSFEYDDKAPIDLRETSAREEGDVTVREVSYAALAGKRNAATLVAGKDASGAQPAILFVHWYDPPEPTSNRTEFLPEAIELARAGVVSLLIDTPWSDPDYFQKRTREGDYARSIEQVKELRRALDVLLAQPQIDRARVALVGHDFGAMYGALAAARDARVRLLVFMAGTQSFSDWFLYGPPKLAGAARAAFVNELAPLDPIRFLPALRVPVLLQFGDHDIHVSNERAQALAAAAVEPKTVHVYEAGHELNDHAKRDRLAWLRAQLQLPPK